MLIGATVEGRWCVERRLGSGGMAEVFLARDLRDQSLLALKVMARPPAEHLTECLRRFRREYFACSRVRHRNVIRLIGLGTAPDGSPYYAMEYVEGRSLAAEALEKGRLSHGFVLDVAGQLADALAAIHGAGVVHRDLKPANVLLDQVGRVVLMDFGLARDLSGSEFTEEGSVLGTICYLAPESLLGSKVDGRADLWALGALLHELLSGRPAFTGRDFRSVAEAIVTGRREPLATAAPGVDPGWSALVDRCLALDPKDRYQRAEEVRADLERLKLAPPPGAAHAP